MDGRTLNIKHPNYFKNLLSKCEEKTHIYHGCLDDKRMKIFTSILLFLFIISARLPSLSLFFNIFFATNFRPQWVRTQTKHLSHFNINDSDVCEKCNSDLRIIFTGHFIASNSFSPFIMSSSKKLDLALKNSKYGSVGLVSSPGQFYLIKMVS